MNICGLQPINHLIQSDLFLQIYIYTYIANIINIFQWNVINDNFGQLLIFVLLLPPFIQYKAEEDKYRIGLLSGSHLELCAVKHDIA